MQVHKHNYILKEEEEEGEEEEEEEEEKKSKGQVRYSVVKTVFLLCMNQA